MNHGRVEGLVIEKYSGFYYVQVDKQDVYECKLRRKIKGILMIAGLLVIIMPLEDYKV